MYTMGISVTTKLNYMGTTHVCVQTVNCRTFTQAIIYTLEVRGSNVCQLANNKVLYCYTGYTSLIAYRIHMYSVFVILVFINK